MILRPDPLPPPGWSPSSRWIRDEFGHDIIHGGDLCLFSFSAAYVGHLYILLLDSEVLGSVEKRNE